MAECSHATKFVKCVRPNGRGWNLTWGIEREVQHDICSCGGCFDCTNGCTADPEPPWQPVPTICQHCQPGKVFFTHSDDEGDTEGRCSEVVDQGEINNAPVMVLCACKQLSPVPYNRKKLHGAAPNA